MRLAVAVAMTAAFPTSLAAQLVRGEIVDALNDRPVPAAFVLLMDTAGVETARTMTDPAGRFTLRAGRPGTFTLRTLVVGYQRWESEPLVLGAGQSVEPRIALMLVRVELPAFTVEGERTCRGRPDEGAAAATLWEEIQKALAATEWEQGARRYRFATVTVERTLDRYAGLLSQDEQVGAGFDAWPFGTLEPERLMASGFVQDAPGGPIYYGPDARVLVSEPFLAAHCFRLEKRREADTVLVGLGFEPVAGRRLPDIAGVLWVDSATVALRRLEYRYANLPRWVPEPQVGGTVEFAQLPGGAWYIRRWRLRAPIPEVRPLLGDTVLYGYRERAGDVVEVLTKTGESVIRFERR